MLSHGTVIFLLLFYYISSIEVGVPTSYKKLTLQFEKFSDGNQFIRNIINGSKLIDRPELIMFTAPYKLCDGKCSEEKIMMAFPLYIGNSAKQQYKKMYGRNHWMRQGDGFDEHVSRRDRIGNEKKFEISDFQKDQKAKFCCPQPIMMPTFITGNAFDEIIKRLQEIHQ